MNDEQIRWLTWGAIQHRPNGAPRWDEPGTTKAIREVCGTWDFATATEIVLAHARDPKARTPFAIKGPRPNLNPTVRPREPEPTPDQRCSICFKAREACTGADHAFVSTVTAKRATGDPDTYHTQVQALRAELAKTKGKP